MANRTNKLQSLCLLYIITWGISPPLQIGTVFRVLLIMAFIIWNLFAVKKCGNVLLNFEVKLFAFLAILIGIAWIADGFSSGVVANLQVIIFFCYLCVFEYYYITGERPMWVFVFIIALIALWNMTTLIGFMTQRNIARLMAKEFAGMETYMRKGIGGYGYVYSVVFAMPILVSMTLRHIKEFRLSTRILLVFTTVSSAFLVIKAGYSIAVILTFIGIIVTLIYRRTTNSGILVLFLIFASVMILLNLEQILNFLRPYAQGSMYESKVRDMLSSLTDETSVGTVYDRMERYLRSIKLFFDSPLWGQLSRTDVGKHSAILDRYAQFGVVLGSIFVYYVSYAQRRILKLRVEDGMALATLVVTVLLFLLNNIAYSMGITLFVLFPVAVNIITRNESCQSTHLTVHRSNWTNSTAYS